MSVKLNDPTIREGLINKLQNQTVKPRAIIEELRVHNGNAIADVVGLYKEAHCYEIKSDLDKIERIQEQSQFYNLSFPKVSLVTTERHVEKALDIAPAFWGVVVVKARGDNIVFHSVRKAGTNPEFCKRTALLTLWKAEMLDMMSPEAKLHKKDRRELLVNTLSKKLGKVRISQGISTALVKRQGTAELDA